MISSELSRDCEAIQIPSGTPATLPKGTEFSIAQTLGGTYTVRTSGGLFRITGNDADALGIDPIEQPQSPSQQDETLQVTEEEIWETLKTCYDPEIPVNIVDLGLVYDMCLDKLPGGANKVEIKMTLTAPGCGMGATIAGDAQQKLLSLPGMEEAVVEIVWEPLWHQSMITPAGRRILGIE